MDFIIDVFGSLFKLIAGFFIVCFILICIIVFFIFKDTEKDKSNVTCRQVTNEIVDCNGKRFISGGYYDLKTIGSSAPAK